VGASDTLTSLPTQVSPPKFALSALPAQDVDGVEVLALPVLPADGEDAGVLLGPGADEVGDLLGTDLLALLEMSAATGKTGEIVTLPLPGGTPDQESLRWVLLVGVGRQQPIDFRRAGAALARAVKDRGVVATTIPALAGPGGLERSTGAPPTRRRSRRGASSSPACPTRASGTRS
jgi:leucyl aminopeptidase